MIGPAADRGPAVISVLDEGLGNQSYVVSVGDASTLAVDPSRNAAPYLVGALLSGLIADLFGMVAAIGTVAGITAAGAALVAIRMYETHPLAERPSRMSPDGEEMATIEL